MKEIGGYIELDTYALPMLHKNAIPLNSGRNALAYLFRLRNIRKIKLPYFICASIPGVCDREGVAKSYYRVGLDFRPEDALRLEHDEWLFLVNFYGQLSNEDIAGYADRFGRVIVDNTNAYFQMPVEGVDTLYSCRKYFGVADGAFLYADKTLDEEFPQDASYGRMRFLLGRYERTASEFYADYAANNRFFADEPIKKMSKLTRNLLRGIDYAAAETRRRENFDYLHRRLGRANQLRLKPGTFSYPFKVRDGARIRKQMQAEKIYIPTLWPTVFEIADSKSVEYEMARDILPLPIDQRYGLEEMEYVADRLDACMERLEQEEAAPEPRG